MQAMPQAVKDCESIKDSMGKIAKMAEIFAHPWSLVWQVGKNLFVNGADIFGKISLAMQSYQSAQYYEFGKNLGEALSEVFFNQTNQEAVKRVIDVQAYDFLYGFFSGFKTLEVDMQALYNNINGRGLMVWGPVQKLMTTIVQNNGTFSKMFWIQIHEVEHIF